MPESTWFAMGMGVALKSTAVLGAAWLMAMALRHRSAAARHLVWTAAAAALVALPFFSAALPALPIGGARVLMSGPVAMFEVVATGRASTDPISQARTTAATTTAPARSWSPDWRLSAMLLWAAGSVILFAQTVIAYIVMWRVRRRAMASTYSSLATELARDLGIREGVDVLETAEGGMPMTFGIVHPAVFLPRDAERWSDERRRIVLMHELAHVRRGDVAMHLLARLALVLNWWNPLAWTAWREFLKERERATDDLVLQAGARASDYATHLLEVARAMQGAPMAAVAMARRSQLEGRLLAILDSHVNRNRAGRASALAAALVAIAAVAPFAALRAQNGAAQALPADLDATIRSALAQKNHEILEQSAAALEASRQYDAAEKLLESAANIRKQVSGSGSVEYGVGLIKLGDLEVKRNSKDALIYYTKAAQVLGDRPEAAPAITYLGITAMGRKNYDEAIGLFQKVERVDPAQAGRAMMWIALANEWQGNAVVAEAMFKASLAAQDPESIGEENTLVLYGRFLELQGRTDDAKPDMDQAAGIRRGIAKQVQQQPKASASLALHVGGGVTPPKVLSKVDPEYSDAARAAKYQGTVLLSTEIGPDGLAHNIQVLKGLGFGLDEEAIAAITQWKFQPGTKDGQAVTVAATIEINFRLR